MIRYTRFVLIFLFLWAGIALAAKAPAGGGMTSDDCLACHNDPSLSKEVNGKQVSLYVNETKFKASMHGSMFQCTDCHTDVKSVPHDPTPARVHCATCHQAEQQHYNDSVHAKAIKAGEQQGRRLRRLSRQPA